MSGVICNAAVQASNAARLARAKGYPYVRPSSSFLYLSGAAFTFNDAAWQGPDHIEELSVTSPTGDHMRAADAIRRLGITWDAQDERTPVLAIGSNAGPEQLLRKYPPDMFPDGVLIPCVRCMLADFDVAFAPLISSYGSCTATLEYSPGTTVETFVTFLTAAQLQRMHETEGAYVLVELSNLDLTVGLSLEAFRKDRKGVEVLHTVYQYNHQSGTLWMPLSNGSSSPIAIKAIRAHRRRFPELDQVQMLRTVSAFTSTGESAGTNNRTPASTDGIANGAGKSQGLANGAVGAPPPHVRAQPQEQAEGHPDQATAALVHDLADCADHVPPAQHGDASTSQLLHTGNGIADAALDSWILENLDDPSMRSKRIDVLTAAAMPIRYSHAEVLMTIGNVYDRNVD